MRRLSKDMRRYSSVLLIALAVMLVSAIVEPHARAQPPIVVELTQHEARFRDEILFRLVVEAQTEITDITLFYRVANQPAVTHAQPEFTPDARVEAEYSWDLTTGALPPGVQVVYWWEITDERGNTLETQPKSLSYVDERYEWETLRSDLLALHWYRGTRQFGQTLFDKGLEALDVLGREAGVTVTDQVQVFIYGSHTDLMGAIAEGAKEWTGGQAFPDMGVVVIGVAPSSLAWGKRAVAHELSHLVIHQTVDTPLGGLPRWLDEGLAMYAEGDLERSYRTALEQAVREGELITVRSLSSSFPSDSDLAHLSYAQSYSLVDFILEEHGRNEMAHLLAVFAEGAYHDDALQEVLGVDSDGLDTAWQDWIGVKTPGEPRVAPPRPPEVPSSLSPVGLALAGLCCAGGALMIAVALGLALLFGLRRRSVRAH